MQETKQRMALFSVHRVQASMMAWYGGIGLQFVLLPVAGLLVLQLPPLQFASLYGASLLAMLFLIPVRFRDDAERIRNSWAPRLWRNLMGVGWLLTAALAVLIWQGGLTLPLFLLYCFLFAGLMTFFSPLRDAVVTTGGSDLARSLLAMLLAQKASYKRMKYTTIRAMVLQFAAQALGFALAGVTAWLPYVWLLPLAQTGLWLGGAAALYNAPRVQPLEAFHHKNDDGSLRYPEGFGGALAATRYAAPKIYPMLLVNLGMGLFIVSPFFLLLPYLLVQAGGDMGMLAALNLAFWGGTMLTTGWMLYRPLTRQRGLNLCVAILVSCGALALVPQAGGNLYALLALCAFWGLANGVLFVLCRTLLQVCSPAGTWHRIIQVYHYLFLLGLLAGIAVCAWFLDTARLAETAAPISWLGAAAMAVMVLALAVPLARKR